VTYFTVVIVYLLLLLCFRMARGTYPKLLFSFEWARAFSRKFQSSRALYISRHSCAVPSGARSINSATTKRVFRFRKLVWSRSQRYCNDDLHANDKSRLTSGCVNKMENKEWVGKIQLVVHRFGRCFGNVLFLVWRQW